MIITAVCDICFWKFEIAVFVITVTFHVYCRMNTYSHEKCMCVSRMKHLSWCIDKCNSCW